MNGTSLLRELEDLQELYKRRSPTKIGCAVYLESEHQ